MARRLAVLAITAVLALAVGLRVWGIGWGLPTALHYFSYHPDETMVLFAATNVNFLEGQLDPGFYNYGSLYIYLVSISILLGSISGLVNLTSGGALLDVGEIVELYMAGRIAALLLGIATVYLVYTLGKRAYGQGVGLLAALFMAVMPIHVMHSKFLAVDVPAAFFVVVALLFAVRISEGHRLRDYLLAGFFAGLAAGTKYNTGLVVLAPVVTHLASGKAKPLLRVLSPKLLCVLIAAAVGFLIGTPGAVFNYDAFSHDFIYEALHARTGHGLVFTDTGCGYLYHLTNSLWPGMGLPLLVLAIIGIIYAIRKRTTADLALLTFLIAYYGLIGAAQVRFARYTIPLLPVMAILAARVSVDLIRRLGTGRVIARSAAYVTALVLALVAGYTLFYSLSLDRMFASPDTRDRAAAWVKQNVLPGVSIGLPTIPWFYTAPLDPYFGDPDPKGRYERVCEFTDYVLVVSETLEWNAGFLEQESPAYVILSEFEYEDALRIRDTAALEYFDVLDREYLLARGFADAPSLLGKSVPLIRELPHDMSYASPTILIYSRKLKD